MHGYQLGINQLTNLNNFRLMLDLLDVYYQAVNNIRVWRNRYIAMEYPHKLTINIIYRAYTMQLLWNQYINGDLPNYVDFNMAQVGLHQIYGKIALTEVAPNLEKWLTIHSTEPVGTVIFSRYEALAKEAETNSSQKEEVEFSYIFELLNDESVLAWISLRQIGYSEIKALSQLTGIIIEPMPFNYLTCKQVFQQLLVKQFMDVHYHPIS
jgi:hypothetical protein